MRCLRDLADYTNSLFNKECDPFDMIIRNFILRYRISHCKFSCNGCADMYNSIHRTTAHESAPECESESR
jgi:hypothetical protein